MVRIDPAGPSISGRLEEVHMPFAVALVFAVIGTLNECEDGGFPLWTKTDGVQLVPDIVGVEESKLFPSKQLFEHFLRTGERPVRQSNRDVIDTINAPLLWFDAERRAAACAGLIQHLLTGDQSFTTLGEAKLKICQNAG